MRESFRRAGARDGVGCRAVQGEGLGRRWAKGWGGGAQGRNTLGAEDTEEGQR